MPLQVSSPSRRGENNTAFPAVCLAEIKSATACKVLSCYLTRAFADPLPDSKKKIIFNFTSDSYLASFPVTLMAPESRRRNAFPLFEPEKPELAVLVLQNPGSGQGRGALQLAPCCRQLQVLVNHVSPEPGAVINSTVVARSRANGIINYGVSRQLQFTRC